MTNLTVSQIRNFSIIAHIGCGKSILADRLLQEIGIHESIERVKYNPHQ